jgi:hypothetical protein
MTWNFLEKTDFFPTPNDYLTPVGSRREFTSDETIQILASMQLAYDLSPKARDMFDRWLWLGDPLNGIETGKRLSFTYDPGFVRAIPGSGNVNIDPSVISNLIFVTKTGTVLQKTLMYDLIHELVHALLGYVDVQDHITDIVGNTVRYSNRIYSELGLDEQASYLGQEKIKPGIPSVLKVGYQYTNGLEIDSAWVEGAGPSPDSFNSSFLQTLSGKPSRDLLVGGESQNTFIAGAGNDFLFGGGGADTLRGGDD